MPLDAYSFCPAGTGKRIKFCCKDILTDLQEIDQMLEGDQHAASLERIERAERKAPDRACLLALKCQLLQDMERVDEFRTTVQRFVEKHPDNAVAWAEQAILAAHDEGGMPAMAALQRAMELAQDGFPGRLYDAMGNVAHALVASGDFLSGRALFLMQTLLDPDDSRPVEMVVQLNSATNVPLLLKDDPTVAPGPTDVPWADAFNAAMQDVSHMRWRLAAERLAAVANQAADAPVVWRNLGVLRSWLADREGSAAAWRKYAALDIPWEDASEAQALAMILSDNPLGDQDEIQVSSFIVGDAEQARGAIAGSRQALSIPPDRLPAFDDSAPPPKAAFLLVDRPPLELPGEPAIEQIPRALAHVLLYGRETDRPARVETMTVGTRRAAAVHALLGELLPELRGVAPTSRVIGRVSASRQLLRRDWHLPATLTPEQGMRLASQFLTHVLLEQWPKMPLGLFGGKSPSEAAIDPTQRVPLLAAILVMEYWTEQAGETFDFNLLRSALGLPKLGPIDPGQIPVSQIPLGRLARVEMEKLDDESLLTVFRRALGFRALAALEKAAHSMATRPNLQKQPELILAYRRLAEAAHDTTQALDYIERGRSATLAAGESCAPWDFLEVSVRLERGEGAHFSRLINHLRHKHIQEPEVAPTLHRMLIELGVIRPEGAMPAEPASEPSIVVPGTPGGQPGKLWTPDGGGESGQKSKIWTPE